MTEAMTEATTQAGGMGMLGGMGGTILYVVVLIAIFYFLLIRPQKKQQQKALQMLDAMQVGDEVVTVGGIVGKVLSIKEDSVTLESGADKVKLKFEKSAVRTVLTVHE